MKLIAHRGGRGFGTDNTLEAMEKAASSGVRMIETDIRASADGRLVICHDATIWGRIVSKTTYDELKKHAPERPLLLDVLESLAGWVAFNLEIKDAPVRAVGEIIEMYRIESETLVTSFNTSYLGEFKKEFPAVRTGFLYRMPYNRDKKLEKASAIGAEVVLPFFHSVNPELVYLAHRKGLDVYAWTVDSEEDLDKLYEWGVDAVITDRFMELKVALGKNYTT
ncbi:MAG: glycerophosphodiester phosphodiesterase [Actinobacteria bacterium]|nr:glycerophosphodiester phosphodiesterase [Actinomycetota bacterium]